MPQDHPANAAELRHQAKAFRRRAQDAQAHADGLWKQAQECDEKADRIEAKTPPGVPE